MRLLLTVAVLGLGVLCVSAAPPTCYSRVLGLSKEIMETYQMLQRSIRAGPCIEAMPNLYLDIHNSCVLPKLRKFISVPKCGRLPRISALKEKARNLYTIMIGACRRDLVFFYDDCDALESPRLISTHNPTHIPLIPTDESFS